MMKYRRLGNAGMKVSAVSLGGWINFELGKEIEKTVPDIITRAIELGINFFDLADVYGYGSSEKLTGSVLKDFPRHTLVVSTKVYSKMSDDINDRGLSRKHIMESITKSLDRLQIDYIDIYFCHRPDPETPMRETVKAMNDLVEQGLVHYWGTSQWEPEHIIEAYQIADRYGWALPQTDQPQYSMLHRDRVENRIIPVTEPRGIGLVPYSPLAMGMLTGKYDEGIPKDSRFSTEPWAKGRYHSDKAVQQVRDLKPIADELGITRAQLALAWCLRQPNVSSVITGASRISQVEDNVKAVEIELSQEQIAQIDTIFSRD